MNFHLDEQFQHSNPRSFSKFSQKNEKKTLKIGEFFVFGIFGVNLFHLEKSNYLFGKAYWTTILCHVEGFQHFNSRYLSKN